MTKRWTAALLVLPLLVGVAACGDDDDDADASAPTTEAEADGGGGGGGGDDAATCDTWLDITEAFNGEPTIEQMDPLFDDMEANAPEEIADDVRLATSTAREVLETGDFAKFETPEMGAAIAAADGYHYESCNADEKVEVNAVDYAFTGMPDELDAGSTIFFAVTNATTHGESHEMGVARKKEGETMSWDDILALPEDEADTHIEFAGGTFAEGEGDTGYLFMRDLAAGEYIAVCFIPVGGEDDGAPHFTEGMKHEFTVS